MKKTNKLKQNKGITLIALVITIIVLLILAGVSISAITGNDSAMEKAKQAKTASEKGDELDTVKLAVVDAVAHSNDGFVTLTNLQNAVKDLDGVTAAAGEEAGTFEVTGKKASYTVSANGQVERKSGLSISPTSLKIAEGETKPLRATLTGDAAGKQVTWTTSGDAKIIVNNAEVTSTTTAGTSEITVKAAAGTITVSVEGEADKTCTVSVQNPTVADLKPAQGGTVVAVDPTGTTNKTIQDKYENDVIIPAGFGIASDSGESVQEGIVIEDASNHNQFVWVPVGTFNVGNGTTKTGTKTVNLTRFDWIDTKAAVSADTAVKGGLTSTTAYYSEAASDSVAIKDANNKIEFLEKSKADAAGGFYIGRYETGSGNVSKAGVSVSNNVTRDTAKSQAQSMYNSKTTLYKSDLVNSYAWDTTIDFIQKCGTKANSANYAYQVGYSAIDVYSPQATGANKLLYNGNDTTNAIAEANRTFDKQCNIFDMAGNAKEWTTEYSSCSGYPCVYRGGIFNSTSIFSASRDYDNIIRNFALGFRALLYIM